MKNKNFQSKNTASLENIEDRNAILARLVGLLLTDGGVSCISGKWRIHFTSNSLELINEFRNIMKQLYGYSLATEKRFGAITVRTWINQRVKNELLSLSPSYRTMACRHFPVCPKLQGKNYKSCAICSAGEYPPAKIPDFVFENENLARELLRCALTADGTVTFNIGKARYGFRIDRCVKLYCEHPKLRKQYFDLLEKLYFKPIIVKDGVILRKPQNLEKFMKEINFVGNVKITGNGIWNGFNKTDLLKLCIDSYSLKPSQLGKNKIEIYNSLLKLLPVRDTA